MCIHQLKGWYRHCVFGIVTAPREAMLMPDLRPVRQGSGIENYWTIENTSHWDNGGTIGIRQNWRCIKTIETTELAFTFCILDRSSSNVPTIPSHPMFLKNNNISFATNHHWTLSPDLYFSTRWETIHHFFTFCQQAKGANCWFLDPRMTQAMILFALLYSIICFSG